MKLKFGINQIITMAIMFLMFLLGFNLFNQTALLCLTLCYVIPIFICMCNKILKVNIAFLILFLATASYYFFLYFYSDYIYNSVTVVLFSFPMAYLLGMQIIDINLSDRAENVLEKIIFFAAFGVFLNSFISYVTGFSGSTYWLEARYVIDFWTGELIHPTGFNAGCVFMVTFIYYALFYVNNICKKLVILVSSVISIIMSINTASRTNLVIVIVTFISVITIEILSKRKIFDIKKNRKKQIVTVVFLIAVIALIWMNIDEIVSWYSASVLQDRLELSDGSSDGRFDLWKEAISLMGKYPFGNMPMDMYAHNILLDIYRVSGIIPFALFTAFFVFCVIETIKFYKNPLFSNKIRCLILCVIIGVMLGFMVEPIIEGKPINLVMFCIIMGAISSLNRKQRVIY